MRGSEVRILSAAPTPKSQDERAFEAVGSPRAATGGDRARHGSDNPRITVRNGAAKGQTDHREVAATERNFSLSSAHSLSLADRVKVAALR
jgi:hypothetical protein